jgi:Flp pilus assembly protein CpaB
LKRSNRLVLLVGVFLAIVAFVGILLLANGGGGGTGGGPRSSAPPTTGPVVIATKDIPLSTRITADELTVTTLNLTSILPGAFTDPSQVVGQIARQAVVSGAQVTSATTTGGQPGQITNLECPATLRCMAVQVDQVSGVGTVIKTGDYVDMVVGLTADKFPVITVSPTDNSITVVAGINSTSVKLLLQGLQVMGTLLPPVAPPPANSTATPKPSASPSAPSTALNGQQEIVILAVSAQQAEVLKFVQMDGNVTLALRSPADFIDPTTGAPIPPVAAETTGIILKTLVDSYGVLPPEVVQTVTPTATKKP